MKGLELLDSLISNMVRNWSSRLLGDARSPELLEIRRELLSEFRDQIHPTGNGRFTFPYPIVYVQLAAAGEAHRNILESSFVGNNDLEHDVCALLSEAGCAPPAGFSVEVTVIEDALLARTHRPFRIEYSIPSAPAPASGAVVRSPAMLTVLRGEADPQEYVIQSDRTYLGRLREVVSDTGSLRRRNDVAFAENEGTVSREHAFISYDSEARAYRLHDSRSQRGTSVFRDSREVRVPRGTARGLELRSGDEIHLGEARLKFEIRDQLVAARPGQSVGSCKE